MKQATPVFGKASSILQRIVRASLIVSVLTFALMLPAASATAQPLVYVVTVQQQFGTVDLSTGAFHQIGPNTPEGEANLVWAPDGSLLTITSSGNLDAINPQTGAVRVIGPTGLGFNAFDLAEVDGKLYATDFSNNFYSVDPQTGAALLIGPTGIPPDPNVPFTFNADGTMNLCDETLYAVGGKLYATFDSFTIDPVSLVVTPVVNDALYEINPQTGTATLIAPTILKLGASVEDEGRFYAFELVPVGFTQFGPQAISQVVTLDRLNGQTNFVVSVDPAAGPISGAAPVRRRRW